MVGSKLYPRLIIPPDGSFFLFGPRGAGKSTWLRGDDLMAIEVRSGLEVFETDLRGLRAIADLPRVRRGLVVHRGRVRQKTADGIEILPVQAFLGEVESLMLFPDG